MVSPRATESVSVGEIGDRHPVVVMMANPETLPAWFAVKSSVPAGLMAIFNGCDPVVATGQASGVRAPVVGLMEKPVTWAFRNDETYRSALLGVAASPRGSPGLAKGDPGTAVRFPAPSLAKPEMLLPPALAVKTNAAPGVGGGPATPIVSFPGEQPVIKNASGKMA